MATEFTASSRPVNSSHSVTSREITSATVILGGGGEFAGCAATREHADHSPAEATMNMDRNARNLSVSMAEKFGLGKRPQQSGSGATGGCDLQPICICDFRTMPRSRQGSIINA